MQVEGRSRANHLGNQQRFACDVNHEGPTFDGTSTNPYKLITDAILAGVSSGDTIHVASGAYTADLGEFFPLEFPAGVKVEGPTTGAKPTIGGDVIDEALEDQITPAEALVEIIVNTASGNVSGIELRRLKFLGEDEPGFDSPIALRAVVVDGRALSNFVFEHNECTRPVQNDEGGDGWATIQLNVLDGTIGGRVSDNTVEVSDRGGIEVLAKVTGSTQLVGLNGLSIDKNYVTNVNGSSAYFGIAHHAIDGGSSVVNMTGPTSISGNTVRGRGDGIWNGIEVLCEERTDYGHLNNMNDNVVEGCGNDGIVLGADGWGEPTEPEVAVVSFLRNKITDNLGSGIHLLFDRDGQDDGNGYLHLIASESNLIANNGRYGVEWRGLDAGSKFGINLVNATIVYNVLGGHGFTDLGPDAADAFQAPNSCFHQSCIMWENNSNGAQVVGLPTAALSALLSLVYHSDWTGIAATQGNISTDPKFVNVLRQDYHLDDDPASPCIDAGCATECTFNTLTDFDLDGEDREQNGDCTGTTVVDMGCYEFAEDCP